MKIGLPVFAFFLILRYAFYEIPLFRLLFGNSSNPHTKCIECSVSDKEYRSKNLGEMRVVKYRIRRLRRGRDTYVKTRGQRI